MKTNYTHEPSEAHPRVYHDVADDFLMTMSKMKFYEIAPFMQKVITENPELFCKRQGGCALCSAAAVGKMAG